MKKTIFIFMVGLLLFSPILVSAAEWGCCKTWHAIDGGNGTTSVRNTDEDNCPLISEDKKTQIFVVGKIAKNELGNPRCINPPASVVGCCYKIIIDTKNNTSVHIAGVMERDDCDTINKSNIKQNFFLGMTTDASRQICVRDPKDAVAVSGSPTAAGCCHVTTTKSGGGYIYSSSNTTRDRCSVGKAGSKDIRFYEGSMADPTKTICVNNPNYEAGEDLTNLETLKPYVNDFEYDGLVAPINDPIPVVIGKLIQALLGIIGTITLIMFVAGGLIWMTAAGNDVKVAKGRSIIVWAFLGLVTVFFSYILVKFVFEILP